MELYRNDKVIIDMVLVTSDQLGQRILPWTLRAEGLGFETPTRRRTNAATEQS